MKEDNNNNEKIESLEAKIGLLEKTIEEVKRVLACEKQEFAVSNLTRYGSLTVVEQRKIESIMRDFDFEKVHDVMQYLDWHWVKVGVPTVEDIKAEAKRLLVDACYEKTIVSTGGLRATYEATPGSEDGEEFIQLEFILTDAEGFDEDEDDE